MLPENTELGKLEYIEVIDYYDFPQFFSCKNELGDIYLGLAIEDNPLTFLFAQIESQILTFSELTTRLPLMLLADYYNAMYRVEIVSTGDTAILMTENEVNKVLVDLMKETIDI